MAEGQGYVDEGHASVALGAGRRHEEARSSCGGHDCPTARSTLDAAADGRRDAPSASSKRGRVIARYVASDGVGADGSHCGRAPISSAARLTALRSSSSHGHRAYVAAANDSAARARAPTHGISLSVNIPRRLRRHCRGRRSARRACCVLSGSQPAIPLSPLLPLPSVSPAAAASGAAALADARPVHGSSERRSERVRTPWGRSAPRQPPSPTSHTESAAVDMLSGAPSLSVAICHRARNISLSSGLGGYTQS